ncbi:hypothetical protein VNN41_09925 [Lactococcus garvieae]|uniref:hypothetical protein n=1 Tax=Lactococcus garvieae TaxID=1363 RepID=UPI003252223B
MHFNKTLKTLLRAKQEGQSEAYKAGFNDALNLLEQEEAQIQWEGDTVSQISGTKGHENTQVHEGINNSKDSCEHHYKNRHKSKGYRKQVAHEAAHIAASLSQEFDVLREESLGDTPISVPKTVEMRLEPEVFELNDGENTQDDSQETQVVHDEITTPQNVSENQYENSGNDTQGNGDEAELDLEQRQLEAMAEVQRQVEEEIEEEDDNEE